MAKDTFAITLDVIIKLCPDDEGFLWATVTVDSIGAECTVGAIIGPPEGLDKEVNNTLAKAGFYTAFDVLGKRKEFKKALEHLELDKNGMRAILATYQNEYFGEKNDG